VFVLITQLSSISTILRSIYIFPLIQLNFCKLYFAEHQSVGMVDTRCWIGLCVHVKNYCYNQWNCWIWWSGFVFLASLSELNRSMCTYRYLQTEFLHITCALCLWDDQLHYCTASGRRWQEFRREKQKTSQRKWMEAVQKVLLLFFPPVCPVYFHLVMHA
jgi:hypothetical protein